jgi:DNA N-6-adenine-methyltransferase (Dam)
VLGVIDLDPATDALPQGWIQAATYFNAEEDGLNCEWHGRVWLNPPFDNTTRWVDKLTNEYLARRVREALLLVNSNAGYRWYEELWRRWPVCCVRERISFIRADGTTAGKAKRAQTFVYLGPKRERFIEVFSKIGRVILP